MYCTMWRNLDGRGEGVKSHGKKDGYIWKLDADLYLSRSDPTFMHL